MSLITLKQLRSSLDAWRAGTLPATDLVRLWRAAVQDWSGLPPRYASVLEQLLMPLEASGLFGGESCSFSSADLAAQLHGWLDHAERVAPRG